MSDGDVDGVSDEDYIVLNVAVAAVTVTEIDAIEPYSKFPNTHHNALHPYDLAKSLLLPSMEQPVRIQSSRG